MDRAERTALENRIYAMRSRCMTVERIATEVSLPRRDVLTILDRLAKRNLAALDKARFQVVIEQRGQLEHIADEALQAWVRSKTSQADQEDAEGKTASSGDPRFLVQAQAALKDIRAVLGLEVNRTEIRGKAEAPIAISSQPYTQSQLVEVLTILADVGALPKTDSDSE